MISQFPINLTASQVHGCSDTDPLATRGWSRDDLLKEMALFCEAGKKGNEKGTFCEQWRRLATPQGQPSGWRNPSGSAG